MDGRKLILMVGALIVAAITAFMARSLIAGNPTPVAGAQVPGASILAPVQDGPEVLVATKALPVGTILDPESMKFQPWPKELVQNAYFIKGDKNFDLKTLQGTVVRYAIPAGQPITQGGLVKPGDRGFLAAALGPGMRAVTVPVTGASSVSGFVFPGDRVDLMLTQNVPGGGEGPPLKVSETVLRNLRVLATDNRTDKQTDDQGKTVIANISTVTVEATPKIAEKIALLQGLEGSLSLALRSIADNAHELDEAIASGEVNLPEGADDKTDKQLLASIAARPSDRGTTYSTGADVSRYQRSTVPSKPPSATGPGGLPVVTGPSVRIARGNNVTVVPLAGKN